MFQIFLNVRMKVLNIHKQLFIPDNQSTGFTRALCLLFVMTSLSLSLVSPAFGLLGGRSGQTELQSNTGTAVQAVCVNLIGLNAMSPLTGSTAELFTRCGEMVHSANALDGTGTQDLSLGLSEEDLAAALQQLAAEEVISPRTQASKTFSGQLRNLSSRLAALRAGATGVSISGLNLNNNDLQNGPLMAGGNWGNFGVPRGGGASGDANSSGFSRLGLFINGIVSFGEKDGTAREDDFEFDSQGVTVGADYRLLDSLVLGTAFSFSNFDADLSKSATVAGGKSDTKGYTFSLYGTYYLKDFYVEGMGSIGWNDHDLKRGIEYTSNTSQPSQNRTAKGDTDSQQYSFTIGTGYNAAVGSFVISPYGRLTYLNLDIDGFKEKGAGELNLEVKDHDLSSLISAVGISGSKNISWPHGILIPQIRGEWDHEFKNDSETIKTQYIADPAGLSLVAKTESPDRNFFRLGFSVSNVFAGGTQAFFDYETFLGLRDITNHIFTGGVRHEF